MPITGGEIRPGFLGDTVIEYNNFKFSEFTTFRWDETAVYNESGNSIDYKQITLVVDSIIPKSYLLGADNGSADGDVRFLRELLMAPRRKLKLRRTGHGDYADDDLLSNKSISGVKPINFVAENLGDGVTMRIVWTAQLEVSPYTEKTNNTFGNYYTVSVSNDYDISDRNILVRTTKFVVKSNKPFEPGSDTYRSQSVIANFFISIGYDITKWEKTGLEFSFYEWKMTIQPDRKTAVITRTERQIDSRFVFPPGCYSIDINHKVSSSLDKGFRLWTNEFSGTIVPTNNTPQWSNKLWIWAIYSSLFKKRYELGIQKYTEVQGYGSKKTRILFPRILSIDIEDELYNTESVSFRIRYDQQVNSIAEIWPKTGILQGPNTSYSPAEWKARMYGSSNTTITTELPHVSYGSTKYRPSTYTDKLGREISNDGKGGIVIGEAPYNEFMGFYDTLSPQSSYTTQVVCPPKEDSWRSYQEKWSYVSNRDIHRHERYKSVATKPNQSSSSTEFEIKSDVSNETDNDTSDVFFLTTGNSHQQLLYQGAAIRYGGPTNPPDISRHGNKELKLINEVIDDRIVSSTGCPIHLTKWAKTYEIVGTIDTNTDMSSTMDRAIVPEDKQHS